MSVRPTWYAGGVSWHGEAWTMLHVPYTGMVLSFVLAGAVVSPRISWTILLATLLAYFLALGVGAHFLDQLPGMGSRYVHIWPPWMLAVVGFAGVGAGIGIGVLGSFLVLGPAFLVFVLIQAVGAFGYPLAPLFRGWLHRDSVFAIMWGSLPFLTSYYAQSRQIVSVPSVTLVATFAVIALIEIRASRWSRDLRRRARSEFSSGPEVEVPGTTAFHRPDRILQVISLGTVALVTGAFAFRLVWGG
jgi:hypothetical protein